MYSLNEEEVSLIRKEVDRQDIHLRHLAFDLVDHISCEIEEMIAQGRSFQEAYRTVLQTIGIDGLDQIQKDTLYLTDKKYRIMKNSMKISGVAGMALLSFGALFKIQHYPGADLLIVTGFLLLGAVFFPISMMVMRKESQQLERPMIYLTALIGGLAIIFAILLKVEHWPGASPIFITGYALLSLVFLPLILISLLKSSLQKSQRITYIMGAVSLFLCLVGTCAKFNHWPGAFITLILGSIGLTTVFFPLYSLTSYQSSQKLEPRFIFIVIGLLYFNLFNLLLAYN